MAAFVPATVGDGGVELGKQIATTLLPAVASDAELPVTDPVTRALLAEIRPRR